MDIKKKILIQKQERNNIFIFFFLGISNIEYRSAPILHSVEFDDVIVYIIGQSGPIRMQLQSFSATYAIYYITTAYKVHFNQRRPLIGWPMIILLLVPSFPSPAQPLHLRNNDVTIMTHIRIGQSPCNMYITSYSATTWLNTLLPKVWLINFFRMLRNNWKNFA